MVVGVLAVAAPALVRGLQSPALPAASPELVSGMRWLERETPRDAVVWAQWEGREAARSVAQAEAYRLLAPRVLGMAQRILGDRGLAEEVVQDTFVTLSNDFPEDVRVQMYFINGDGPL